MQKKFKLIWIVLMVFMVVLALAIPSFSAKSKTEIVFWNLFGGGEGDFVDKIVNDFNNSQSAVAVKTLRLEWNEYYTKFGVSLASGKGPDVAVCHIDRLAPFVKAKQLAGLDGVTKKAGFSYGDIADNLANAVKYGSNHYAVPIDTHFHMLYYHKDILKKADLLNADGTPKLTATPEGFKKFLHQIKDRVPDVTPMPVNTPYFHEPFYNLYYEAGGDILNDKLTKAAINNPKALAVLKFYLDLYAGGLSDINDKNPWQTFSDKKGALWIGGVWEAGNHFTAGSDTAAIPLPPIFGSPVHWCSSHTLVVPAYVNKDKQIAAMKFMKYYVDKGGYLWGRAGHVPAGKKVAASSEYNNLPYRKFFVEAQKTVKFAPKTDKYNAVDTTVKESLQNIIFKKVTPEAGLRELEKAINDILAQ